MPEFPIIHLPAGKRNPNFTGRQQSLEQLRAQLAQSEAIDVVSQAITGLGGIGKTQLVREYIYRHQATYDLIWWIQADNIISITDDLAALAVAVGVIEPSNSDRQAGLNAARRWLGQTDKRWLLIFDNVDELPPQTLQPYLPTHGRGQLIITSRNPNWGGLVGSEAILRLDSFSRAESIAFLRRRLGDTAVDQAQLDPIAELLGDFPLALEHAAAYIEASQISYASYRQQYQQYRQALWRDAQPPQGYHGTISTTWEMAGGDTIYHTGQGNFLNKPQGDVNINQGSGTQNVQKAGRDINYGGQPQDKAAFIAQLAELRSLLEQAIAAKAVKDATTLTEDLAEVAEQAQAEKPNANRIRRRLEDMAETLQATTQVATATGTAATAVAKAALIVNGLVQTVATIFS